MMVTNMETYHRMQVHEWLPQQSGPCGLLPYTVPPMPPCGYETPAWFLSAKDFYSAHTIATAIGEATIISILLAVTACLWCPDKS